MSVSKRPRKPGRSNRRPAVVRADGPVRRAAAARVAALHPLTVSRRPLLESSGDKRFRQLVYDLLTISNRMNLVREHLGRRLAISGPQYSVLMAILQLQGENGVGVSALARLLHVSTAFIATETGKLMQAGYLTKHTDPNDRRAVLLGLTRTGRALIERNGDEIRAINDTFFGALDESTFVMLSKAMASLVRSSELALARINGNAVPASLTAAE
jgi:DNA-binding MarR family transcriptional regulator